MIIIGIYIYQANQKKIKMAIKCREEYIIDMKLHHSNPLRIMLEKEIKELSDMLWGNKLKEIEKYKNNNSKTYPPDEDRDKGLLP